MARLLTALTAAVLAHGAAGRRSLFLQGSGQQARPVAHRVNLRGGSLADEGASPSWSVTATGASRRVRERRRWREPRPPAARAPS